MKRWLQLGGKAIQILGNWGGSFALWSIWLALSVVLIVQLYIASARELSLPDFVLRRIEAELAKSGLRATFSRTSFDPLGRILVENVRVWLPAYADPVVTARAVFVQVNPLMLVVGQVEPTEIKMMDAALAAPAMLSTTGQDIELIRDLEATLVPGEKSFVIQQLSARVAGVAVSARGTVPLPRRPTGAPPGNLGETLTRNFPIVARQAVRWSEYVAWFERPEVQLELIPSESGATSINVLFLAQAARIDQPAAVQATQLRASTRLLLMEDTPTTWVDVSAADIRFGDTQIRQVHAHVSGRLQPTGFKFDLREVAVTAAAVSAAGLPVTAVSAQLYPRPYPEFDVVASVKLFDLPLGLMGRTDPFAGRASVNFTGDLSPRIMGTISDRLRTDVRRFFDFESLAIDQAHARIGDKWQFEKLEAQVRVQGINAYGVRMMDGVTTVELEPHRFYSPEAFARIGENFARGSYEHDLKTHEYRFLLAGRLRPLEISTWFRDWWPNFFRQLEFPESPPNASVDVRGFWREPHRTSVFVQADAPKPVIRGADFERVRTRLFIRPGFFDGLEVVGFRPEGGLRGRFTYTIDSETDEWRTLDLAFDSTVDLSVPGRIVGPLLTSVLAPFEVTGVPTLKFVGEFTGPGSPQGQHQKMRIDALTRDAFGFYKFPLQHVSFRATVADEDITVEDVEAMFAGGVVGGRARLTGSGEQRQLGFDVQLRDASLGQAATVLQEFLAQQKGQPAPASGKFMQEKGSVRLDLAASAEGRYNDLRSFRGSGNATLQGAEIGEVALLGALSEIVPFTTLRFNNAQANVKIESAKLVFPEVKLRGPDSLIDAHGTYALDRRELDFNAKILPFQESENLIKTVVGAVLSPLSAAFEVKLSGTLDDPKWSLLRGPANLLRSLGPGEPGTEPPQDPTIIGPMQPTDISSPKLPDGSTGASKDAPAAAPKEF